MLTLNPKPYSGFRFRFPLMSSPEACALGRQVLKTRPRTERDSGFRERRERKEREIKRERERERESDREREGRETR